MFNIIAVYMHGPGIDNPISMFRDIDGNGSFSEDEAFFYTKDAQGSIRDITDKVGNLVQRYRYSSYGITTLVKVQNSVTTTFIENSYAYTGREINWETGDYYYRARYYDPSIGRFISEDPIRQINGSNLYIYALNSPILYIDPLGNDAWLGSTWTQAAAAGAVVGGVIVATSTAPVIVTVAAGVAVGAAVGSIAESIGGNTQLGLDVISGGIIGAGVGSYLGGIGGGITGGALGGAASLPTKTIIDAIVPSASASEVTTIDSVSGSIK